MAEVKATAPVRQGGTINDKISSLRGKDLLIPSLDGVLSSWNRGVNGGYEKLKIDLMQDFQRMVSDPKKLKKLEMDDYALCGAGMFKNADMHGLHVMSFLVTWLFFFDDKVDHKDGELFGDQMQFRGLAKQAYDFVAYTLDLGGEYEEPEGGLDDFVSLFKPVGEALRALDPERRQFFLDDFDLYLRCLIEEQQDAHSGKIRSFDAYMTLRRGTVCMYTICAGTEIACRTSIPSSKELPISELVELWTEIRDLMIFVNDLYSFKNELQSDNGASLVTLCLEKQADLPAAVSQLVLEIQNAKERFDCKADEILFGSPTDRHADLNQYFDCLKALVTGYHSWCLTTTRYNLKPYVRQDGSVLVKV